MRHEIYRKIKSSITEVVKSESHIRHPGAISCMTLQTRAVKKKNLLDGFLKNSQKVDGRRLKSTKLLCMIITLTTTTFSGNIDLGVT